MGINSKYPISLPSEPLSSLPSTRGPTLTETKGNVNGPLSCRVVQ